MYLLFSISIMIKKLHVPCMYTLKVFKNFLKFKLLAK